jgi:hypothetical protein
MAAQEMPLVGYQPQLLKRVEVGSVTKRGGVSNADINGNNAWQIKAIGVVISTFETRPGAGYRWSGSPRHSIRQQVWL